MTSCIICKREAEHGIALCTGEVVHTACVERYSGGESRLSGDRLGILAAIENERARYKKRSSSIFSKLLYGETNIEREYAVALAALEDKLKSVEDELANLRSLSKFLGDVSYIYEKMLSYPPDWEDRKSKVAERDGYKCSECGGAGRLQLHHIVPLSKGGSNRISNLVLLCGSCHSRSHGGRTFRSEFTDKPTAFSERVKSINTAIGTGRKVKFKYRKPGEIRYRSRVVMPKEMILLKHQDGDGETLCLKGYCELRKADRVFALKRMEGLKIV